MFELYRAVKYGPALEHVEKDMASFPEYSARITFWRMCLLSLCGRADDALSVFSDGLEAGLWWHESLFRDTDFDSIRDLPRFKELVARSKERWKVEGIGAKSERTLLEPAASGPYPLLIALHGFGGNKDSNLNYWEIACRKGWMVLSIQSRLFVFGGSSFWEADSGMEDILHHLHKIRRQYRIDGKQIVLAGFSQGGGMAILAGLSPKVNAAGVIAVAGGWNEVEPFKAAAKNGRSCRCYFVNGLLDIGLERSRQIQAALKENQIPVVEEVHPDLGHEFPPDFGESFENALKYLFS
jgi:predicted esterase